MSGEHIDYDIERQRHEGFVGREALLAWLDDLLIADEVDRWVVVTGGPGVGKSALLAKWLALREAAGAVVPHHFIRRGEYDWDDPVKLVSSLVAQLEELSPELREPDTDARKHPATRLTATLRRVSAAELALRGERLVILIDGLDEYDPPPGALGSDPLGAFLPHALPRGVSFLCASRPKPHVAGFAARDGVLAQLDLDQPALADDNEATVRAFWERAAPELGLNARFVDEAVARAQGNLQHAATLKKHLKGLSAASRRVEDIPRGLDALLARSWQRIAVNPIAARGLGILCAAREALTLDELGAAAGWTDEAQRQAFVHGASELLIETPRANAASEFRLHHHAIRAYIEQVIGGAALRGHHAALARDLATWPPLDDPAARSYALRHALSHRVEARDWADAWRLASDIGFLETKCRELGAHELEADVVRATERCAAGSDPVTGRRFADLTRVLARESHWLRTAPAATAALVWNRLRRSGWSADELDGQLRVPAGATFLRLRHGATRESSALVRELVGHAGEVSACAVTTDGRRAVSASWDRTLRVWDLERGRALVLLEGHADEVCGCAITQDSRRVVSASRDGTLRVWELASGRALATLTGHTAAVNACAVTAGGYAISASTDRTLKVWDLDQGRALATLQGHAGGVTACAVTADGRRVISASDDNTLKVWDLVSRGAAITLEGHTDWVKACAMTADGRFVISASDDNTLKVWNLANRGAAVTLEGHANWVTACAVTADGRFVISASDDRTLKVWDLASGHVLATLEGHADGVMACAVTADGRWAISASKDLTLKVWDLARALASPADRAGGAPAVTEGHSGEVSACSVAADGRWVVSASEDRTLKVWDLEHGHTLATLEGHAGGMTACAVTADGRRAVSAADRTLTVWDLAERHALATLEGHGGPVSACAVTADERCVISGSADRTLRIWELVSGRLVATLEGHRGSVNACAVTADGRRVVSASSDRTLRVWDLANEHALATLEGHADRVNACAVTLDGRRAVSASSDRTLKVWDLGSRRELVTLKGHASSVSACAVTADSRRVVSASGDRMLKVWDLDTYACLFTHCGDAAFTAVAATAAGVVAGDVTGAIWFLEWPEEHPRAPLTRDERPLRTRFSTAPTTKQTILFLAANPSGTDPRALDQEARAIQVELERSGFRECFEFETRWAVEPLDLLRELRRLKPVVIHFSGHGEVADDLGGGGATSLQGLVFQGRDGRPQLVSSAALAEALGAAGTSVKLIVLSACYSEAQARALLTHVDCVVGMAGSIREDAARSFAIGFYGGLGECESVATAFQQGCAAISLEGLRGGDRPRLKVREGVDASQIVLAGELSRVR